MPHIRCTTPGVEARIRAVMGLLLDMGASLADGLVLAERDGSMWLEATEAEGAVAIQLPGDALIDTERFHLVLDGDDVRVAEVSPVVEEDARGLMRAVLDLLNGTGKIRQVRRTSMWAALARVPAVEAHLLRAAPELAHTTAMTYHRRGAEAVWIEAMFEMRRVRWQHHSVVMPLMDLANHALGGAPFVSLGPAGMRLAVARPAGGPELAARYGVYDAFDTAAGYAFVDTDASFVRSIPLSLDLDGVALTIARHRHTHPVAPDAPHLRGLGLYLPTFTTPEPDTVTVSQVAIPGPKAPRALVRVLAEALRRARPDASPATLAPLLRELERRIVHENVAFYEGLGRALQDPRGDDLPAVAILRDMVAHQLALLRGYRPLVGPQV